MSASVIVALVDDLRKKLSVDTVQFILFLFLQNAPRSSLKTPMVAAEEYPAQPPTLLLLSPTLLQLSAPCTRRNLESMMCGALGSTPNTYRAPSLLGTLHPWKETSHIANLSHGFSNSNSCNASHVARDLSRNGKGNQITLPVAKSHCVHFHLYRSPLYIIPATH